MAGSALYANTRDEHDQLHAAIYHLLELLHSSIPSEGFEKFDLEKTIGSYLRHHTSLNRDPVDWRISSEEHHIYANLCYYTLITLRDDVVRFIVSLMKYSKTIVAKKDLNIFLSTRAMDELFGLLAQFSNSKLAIPGKFNLNAMLYDEHFDSGWNYGETDLARNYYIFRSDIVTVQRKLLGLEDLSNSAMEQTFPLEIFSKGVIGH